MCKNSDDISQGGESNSIDPKPILVYSRRPQTPMQTQEYEPMADSNTTYNQEEDEKN